MGKALALLLWVIAIGSVILFAGRYWWFPENISEYGDKIDAQFMRTMIVVAIGFVGAQIALGWVVFRYGTKKGRERATYSHGSAKLEATWTLITAVVFIGLAILGQQVWVDAHLNDAPPDAVKIDVVAQQFQWNFHYPGPDGVLGRTKPEKISDSSLNFVGLDMTDPHAKDDTQVTALAIPVNRPIELTLRSKDVIHNFFVPALRFKQDAVPGMAIRVHFKANKVGRYELVCAELCGQLHYNMKTSLLVLPEDEYDSLTANTEEEFKTRIGELLVKYK